MASNPVDPLASLFAQFKDPLSPLYLPPGARGPADENDIIPSYTVLPILPTTPSSASSSSTTSQSLPPVNFDQPLTAWHLSDTNYNVNRRKILDSAHSKGFDIQRGAIEWPIAWGDVDTFRHVNNVHYLKYFENARLGFFTTHSPPVDPARMSDMIGGRNEGFVIKSHQIKYKSAVTHPDSLVILTRTTSVAPPLGPSSFSTEQEAWSLKTGTLAATCETVLVCFDHNTGGRMPMPETLKAALTERMRTPSTMATGGGESKL